MKICYQIKNGIEYAKTEGSSYRVGNKVLKKDVIYLGRVIDKKNHIFCNRERGTFSYDPDTGLFGKADEQCVVCSMSINSDVMCYHGNDLPFLHEATST